MSAARAALAAVVLTVLAAAAGLWVGMSIGRGQEHHSGGLDDILHHELGLTPEQDKRIAALEAKFALDRKEPEMRMRAANLELARAFEGERAYGEAAKTAISHFHQAMAGLQELTILHVLDMRAALTPAQAEKFDKTVRQTLAPDSP